MKPFPLKGPHGVVYAWACGVCKDVAGGGRALARHKDRRDQYAESSKENAARCCSCRICGDALPPPRLGRVEDRWCCARCTRRATREEKRRKPLIEEGERRMAELRTAQLAKAADADAAGRLLTVMSGISEDGWGGTWSCDLGNTLWRYVSGETPPGEYGRSAITQADVDELLRLSDKAGGWWIFFHARPELEKGTDEAFNTDENPLTWRTFCEGRLFVTASEWAAIRHGTRASALLLTEGTP